MRLVTFGRAVVPHGVGDTRLVPDAVAASLEADGLISASEPWPAAPAPAATRPSRPTLKPRRPASRSDKRLAL